MPKMRYTMTASEEAAWLRGASVEPPSPPSHGATGYEAYRCRCDICTQAERVAGRRQRARATQASVAGKIAQDRIKDAYSLR